MPEAIEQAAKEADAMSGAPDATSDEQKPRSISRWKIVVPVAAAAGLILAFAFVGLVPSQDTQERSAADEQIASLMTEIKKLKESGGDSTQQMANLQEPLIAKLQSLGYMSGGDVERLKKDEAEHDEGGRFNTEQYGQIVENAFLDPNRNPMSTFSIDVDTASYANVRRFLQGGNKPPPDAVRIEELINYFDYAYPEPTNGPFAVDVDVATAPWKPAHRLMRIGLKGVSVDVEEIPPCNLVFLVDTSGSMESPNKLPLLKRAMQMLMENLGSQDRVAIVAYAGSAGLVLPSTSADNDSEILEALERLEAGGSTNGGQGIELAYKVARENFISRGNNRVILATDGDFNVGTTDIGGLIRLAEQKRETGVFLSVLGFGMGNYKDDNLEKLADKGNGNYAYIDSMHEARKVLVEEMGSTLLTIAKDVKIQVEFNPAEVNAYRLIGYENRIMAAEDFNDDTKDAGEIGAGHTVTALYEVVPFGAEVDSGDVDELKYQGPRAPSRNALGGELCTVKLRFKPVNGDTSELIEIPVRDRGESGIGGEDPDLSHAAAVAAFGMLLRDSKYKGASSWPMVVELAEQGLPNDRRGYRQEFLSLVRKAWEIDQAGQ